MRHVHAPRRPTNPLGCAFSKLTEAIRYTNTDRRNPTCLVDRLGVFCRYLPGAPTCTATFRLPANKPGDVTGGYLHRRLLPERFYFSGALLLPRPFAFRLYCDRRRQHARAKGRTKQHTFQSRTGQDTSTKPNSPTHPNLWLFTFIILASPQPNSWHGIQSRVWVSDNRHSASTLACLRYHWGLLRDQK